MKVLIVEPRQRPRRADIPHTLDEMQRIVGGYIQAVYWFSDPVALVCDDEGKLKGYELNRYIAGKDIIAGTFFICGLGAEDFTDLPDDLADTYEKLFRYGKQNCNPRRGSWPARPALPSVIWFVLCGR